MRRVYKKNRIFELVNIYKESLMLKTQDRLETKKNILNELSFRKSNASKLLAIQIELPNLERSKLDYKNIIQHQPKGSYISERDISIVNKWNSGKDTYESIAKHFLITRERVRQILAKHKRLGRFIESTSNISKSRKEFLLSEEIDSSQTIKIQEEYLAGTPKREILELFSIRNEIYQLALQDLKKRIDHPVKLRCFAQIKHARENLDEITKLRNSVILKMRGDNISLTEIAEELGISKIRLVQLIKNLKDSGVNVPNSRDSGLTFTDQELTERINEIEMYLNEEKSVRKISQIMRMSPQHISRLIYKYLIKE